MSISVNKIGLWWLLLVALLNPIGNEASAQGFELQSDEIVAIEATLNDYLIGSRDGSLGRLRRALHPTAEIEGVRGDSILTWSAEEFLGFFTEGLKETFVPRILSVDVTGDIAQAKVEEDRGTWKYVDYIQLLKVGGQWKIVNKLYFRVGS